MRPTTAPSRRRGPVRDLLRMLWQMPLMAVPFALFFGTLQGASRAAFVGAYLGSLVFSFAIGFAVWAAEQFVAPRLLAGNERLLKGGFVRHASVYGGASILGSYAAALFIHFFLDRAFLGGPRSLLVVSMFTLLFTVLIIGLVYAWHFYHSALSRARSEEELDLARRIQRGFLLTAFPRRPRLEIHATNLSSREVSGDFYDVVPAGDHAFLVAIADVSGKGVPAALLSSMLQASVRTQAGMERSTAAIVRNLNRLVCDSTSRAQFATFFLAWVDEDALTLTYTNAGHNPPMLFRRGAAPRALACGGTVVGMLDDLAFEEETLALAPGDRLVAWTDGLSEAQRPDGAMYGDERVAERAAALDGGLGAEAICARLLDDLRAWLAGREAGDDVTVLALRVRDDVAPAAGGAP